MAVLRRLKSGNMLVGSLTEISQSFVDGIPTVDSEMTHIRTLIPKEATGNQQGSGNTIVQRTEMMELLRTRGGKDTPLAPAHLGRKKASL